MTVALVKMTEQPLEDLRRAITLCGGLKGLDPKAEVVIKPNMVMRGYKGQKPDGMVTTIAMMESMITLLREQGCENITIADGGVVQQDLKMNTATAFTWAGYDELSERMGVPLLDLNQGPFKVIELDGQKVEVAQKIMDAGFLINMPVLKTHIQTKVSLGIKNLKGTISLNSKKLFHRHDLHRMVALLGMHIKVDLTVLDGTYALQRGPHGDDCHQADVLVAGNDIFSVDIVGSMLLGINPEEVCHLSHFAELSGRKPVMEGIQVVGEPVMDLVKPLEWESLWPRSVEEMFNITGVTMAVSDGTICSGCGYGIGAALTKFYKDHGGFDFGGIEICSGQEKATNADARLLFCLGKCACDLNKEHKNLVEIKGCPPSVPVMYETLKQHLFPQE